MLSPDEARVGSAIVVDDSRVSRLLIGRSLKTLGFTVTEALHGLEALELLESNGNMDLAIIDGPGLVRAIRDRPALRDMTLLLASATETTAVREMAMSLGSDDFLSKPFACEALATKLRELGFDV